MVFYQPDSVLLKPLDAGMIVGDPGVVYFTMWSGDDGCGDHHVMTRAAATGFAGMFAAAEKAFSNESGGCPVPVGCLRDENGPKEDGQCFKGVYVRQKLGMRTKSSGIDTCRDAGTYRSILGGGCIKDALDAGHGEELRALDLNEAQVRLLFPCPSADLNSCAKGRGQTPKLLKALLGVVNVK